MKYLPLLLLFASVGLNVLSNAKAIIFKYELRKNNLFSPSIITLIKKYNNTINANYRNELFVSICYKLLANVCLFAGVIIFFF